MCQIFAGQDPERYKRETRRLRLNGQSTSIDAVQINTIGILNRE